MKLNNDDWVRITDNVKILLKNKRKPINFNELYELYSNKFLKFPATEKDQVKIVVMDLVSRGYLKFDDMFRIIKNRT